MKLKNEIALITSAGREIWKAIALEFAREGAKLLVFLQMLRNGRERRRIVSLMAIRCSGKILRK